MHKILIVDDEIKTVNILKFILEQGGYDVITAGNGQLGFDIASQDRPDLIITDVLMPVMDGYAFYKKLKENPVTKQIPVIVLTARGAMESSFEALGVDRFMEKPVEKKDLMDAIEALLSRGETVPGRKGHQRVLVAGTYADVVDEIGDYVASLGHEVIKAQKAADILKKSVEFSEDILIIDVQMEIGMSSGDVIRAIRLLPELQKIPVLLYSYYRVSELGSSEFRSRILEIEKTKNECMAAGATEYFDRYHRDVFREKILKYV